MAIGNCRRLLITNPKRFVNVIQNRPQFLKLLQMLSTKIRWELLVKIRLGKNLLGFMQSTKPH